jgi:GntR family transcriptional regulator
VSDLPAPAGPEAPYVKLTQLKSSYDSLDEERYAQGPWHDWGMPVGRGTKARELPSERVTNDLRVKIKNGKWVPGEALPTIAALAKEYKVSTATVSKALATLRGEGLIVTRPRWGSFVAEA